MRTIIGVYSATNRKYLRGDKAKTWVKHPSFAAWLEEDFDITYCISDKPIRLNVIKLIKELWIEANFSLEEIARLKLYIVKMEEDESRYSSINRYLLDEWSLGKRNIKQIDMWPYEENE